MTKHFLTKKPMMNNRALNTGIAFFACLILVSPTLQAEESYFYANQVKRQSTIEINLARLNGTFSNGESTGNQLGILFSRPNENNSSLWIKTGFESREVASRFDKGEASLRGKKNSIGLQDIEAGYRLHKAADAYNCNYGFATSISPGSAQDPRMGTYNTASNVSGLYSLAGQLGIESYVDSLALGGSAELRLYSNRLVSGDNNDYYWDKTVNPIVPTMKGFAELPMSKDVNLGVLAHLSLSSGSYYLGKLYGEWKVDRNMSALLAMTASKRLIPYIEDTNEISVGFRKNL